MSRPVVLDVDGVLADFTLGFTTLRGQMFGEGWPIESDQSVSVWRTFDSWTDSRVWDAIKTSSVFWATLLPLVHWKTFLRLGAVTTKQEVYFVTHRFGNNAALQTQRWLRFWGVPHPLVITTKEKLAVAQLVDAFAILDDKPENLEGLLPVLSGTRKYLLSRPYNGGGKSLPPGVLTVGSVDEFLDLVEEEA